MISNALDQLRREIVALTQRHSLPSEVAAQVETLVMAASQADRAEAGEPDAQGASALRDLGPLGIGGTAEVRRVEDPALCRTMALKRLRPELRGESEAVLRFLEEAQITAQLEHPGILPVHGLGWHPEGDPYFTMKQVRGHTLLHVLRGLHEASASAWGQAPGGWTFRRIIDAFHRASQAVAFAHSRGVIHRDLKPANMMVGDFGEVLVLDWGLAKLVGAPVDLEETSGLDPISTPRTRGALDDTHVGEVSGTPAYMAPEQALGEAHRLGPPVDVYALGAVLFEILTGHPPFRGANAYGVLAKVLSGRREPWPTSGPPLPPELKALVDAAMALDPEARPPDASAFAAHLADWLEGAQRRDRALKRVAEAEVHHQTYLALRADAEAKSREAAQILEPLPTWAPESAKAPGWALEDEALTLRAEAAREELAFVQGAASALAEDPGLPEANLLLADHFRARHMEAEAQGNAEESVRLEGLLRAHDRGAHAA